MAIPEADPPCGTQSVSRRTQQPLDLSFGLLTGSAHGSPTTITLHPRMSDGSRIEDGSSKMMSPTDPQQITVSDSSVWVSEILDHGTGLWGFADVRPILTPADLSMPADEDAGRVLTTRMTMFGLDANGLLTFGGGQQLRWSELVRASDAGLIPGDITNMVIYVDRGAAGGGGHEVYQLIDFLFSERNLEYAQHLKASTARSRSTSSASRSWPCPRPASATSLVNFASGASPARRSCSGSTSTASARTSLDSLPSWH